MPHFYKKQNAYLQSLSPPPFLGALIGHTLHVALLTCSCCLSQVNQFPRIYLLAMHRPTVSHSFTHPSDISQSNCRVMKSICSLWVNLGRNIWRGLWEKNTDFWVFHVDVSRSCRECRVKGSWENEWWQWELRDSPLPEVLLSAFPSFQKALFGGEWKCTNLDKLGGWRSSSQVWGRDLDAEPLHQLPWAKQSTSAAQGSLHNQLSELSNLQNTAQPKDDAVWCFQPNAGKQGDKRGFELCRVHLPGASAMASPDECLLLKCCIMAAFRDACSLLLIDFCFSFTPTLSFKGSSLGWRSCADQCTSLYLFLWPWSFSCPN